MKPFFSLFFTLFTICSFYSCLDDSDKMLLDNFQVEPLVNPITQYLIGNPGSEIRAWMYDTSSIVGFGNGVAFYTPNLFDSLYRVSEGECYINGELLYNTFEQLITRNEGNAFLIQQSDDFGENYTIKFNKSQNENTIIDGTTVTGIHQFEAAAMSSASLGWFFSNYTATTGQNVFPSGLKVYRMVQNGTTGTIDATAIAELPNTFHTTDCTFINSVAGWVLATNSSGTYCIRSGDSGETWETPALITNNANAPNKIVAENFDQIYAYSTNYPIIYTSHDGGLTWVDVPINTGNSVSDIYIVDQLTAFAALPKEPDEIATIGDIYKTINGGETWTKANTKPLYAEYIDFWDEQRGIATSKNVVQITFDGGQTWKPIVYPLE